MLLRAQKCGPIASTHDAYMQEMIGRKPRAHRWRGNVAVRLTVRCPLWVISGQTVPGPKSGSVRYGPKADIRCPQSLRLLCAISGPYVSVMSAKGQIRIAGRPVAFAYTFATFFRSGLSLIPSRASRSSRSLAVSRRVACSLASYAEAACTPSCFHRNKRSARSFFIEVIEGMIDNALLKIIKRTAPNSTEPGAAAYNAQVITSGGHRGCLG